jgi:hypothetical protein
MIGPLNTLGADNMPAPYYDPYDYTAMMASSPSMVNANIAYATQQAARQPTTTTGLTPAQIQQQAQAAAAGIGSEYLPNQFAGFGAYDYYNPGLASLYAQMQGQYLSDAQFWGNLDWQKQQWADQMRQWEQEFGWGKGTDSASTALQQQLARGYIQSNPFLTPEGGFSTAQGDLQKTLEREMGEGNLGLGYLSLLGSLSGPRDWLNYARTVRGAEGTGLPTWAESLISGQQLPAFGAAYQANQLSPVYDQFLGQTYDPYGVNRQASLGPEQAVLQAGAQGQNYFPGFNVSPPQGGQQGQNEFPGLRTAPPGGGQPGQYYLMGAQAPAPQVRPTANGMVNELGVIEPSITGGTPQQPSWSIPLANKITQAQWQRMLPSEQEMLLGAVESGGGYGPDYVEQMQRAWQPRKVNPTTMWG